MHIHFHDEQEEIRYNGDQLKSLFPYSISKVKGDCLVAFFGQMDVRTDHMVDMEDVLQSDYIWSPLAFNMVVEIFHIGIESAVLYQRSLMQIATETLRDFLVYHNIASADIKLEGDDIMVKFLGPKEDDKYGVWKKLSVSIATVSHISGLIHSALNVDVDDKIPVPATGLRDILIESSIIVEYCKEVCNRFKDFVHSVKLASVKVKGV
jgi:hypothetical protein